MVSDDVQHLDFSPVALHRSSVDSSVNNVSPEAVSATV